MTGLCCLSDILCWLWWGSLMGWFQYRNGSSRHYMDTSGYFENAFLVVAQPKWRNAFITSSSSFLLCSLSEKTHFLLFLSPHLLSAPSPGSSLPIDGEETLSYCLLHMQRSCPSSLGGWGWGGWLHFIEQLYFYWGIADIQPYIHFKYTTSWFNICIHCKMITTISEVSMHWHL